MSTVIEALNTIGLATFLLVVVTGTMMGYYLASINGFVRVRSLRRSLITNLVAATSFLYPVALQREFVNSDNLAWSVWLAMWLLFVVFTMLAGIANWVLCKYREQR